MLPQEALDADDPRTTRLATQFLTQYEIVVIERIKSGPVGNCYENVRQQIAEHGGRATLGWVPSHFPGHYIELLHHAVWQDELGQLHDVTGPSYPAMLGKNVVFIRDPQPELDPVADPFVPSWFHCQDDLPGTKEYIRLTRERMILRARVYALIKRHAVPVWREGLNLVTDGFPTPAAEAVIAPLLTRASAIEERREAYIRRLSKGIFSKL